MRMTVMSSSQEPTSVTAGHAARRTDRPVPQAVRHIGRQRRRDAQAKRHSASTGTGILRRAEPSITIELA
jgi:hypothetical protein